MTYNKAIKVIEYMLSKNPYNKEVVEALTLACTILKKQINDALGLTHNIAFGESKSCDNGSVLHFDLHSAITIDDEIYLVLTPITLIKEDNTLKEVDGSVADLSRYTIKITKEAHKEYLQHFEFGA